MSAIAATLTAVMYQGDALDGNTLPAYVFVSPVDPATGGMILNLVQHDFTIQSPYGPPGAAVPDVQSAVMHGNCYQLKVVPHAGNPWKKGIYVVVVLINSRICNGQTIITGEIK